MRLIECVPNFSEGRRTDVVDALVAVVLGAPEVHLLDHGADRDHNRSVLTFAGPPRTVTDVMERLVEVALERIDMEQHTGQHPRMGAVDVIPFVPLGETTLEEAIALAGEFGERIAERFELPVYLYAMAAVRPGRRILADVRRPQYEGLKKLIAEDPERAPDFGPSRMHPTGGAVAVGARPPLIAYNIDLATEDLELARRIAGQVREKGGGLPRVQALGLFLEDRRSAQVSMNLLDHTVTPLWQVFERVSELAAAEGIDVRASELIGLAPLAALTEVADHFGIAASLPVADRISEAAGRLQILDFEPTKALELRLSRADGEGAGDGGGDRDG